MKYFFTLLITLFCFSQFVFSQSQNAVIETVYLKNGSIVKGVILEQVPDDYLKMQTYDGSIFVFKMEEVEKITKDFSSTNTSTPKQTQLSDQISSKQDGIRASGGRAFIDLGYAFGTGTFSLDRVELTTSAGYQFNPYIFLGGRTWNSLLYR